MNELPIPPDAEDANVAIEIARGWIVDDRLQCSILPTIWKDTPEVWGILLADLLSHVCDALASETDMTRDQLHRIITKKLIDEIGEPTDKHSGDFIDE
ncbi:hypothetical protein Lepto7375DRAFT_1480 [Leptolyngbya sp. PCC 7375]|nr:hypothetical protein Lepto7375DRAFT_1480 [Leptolyngbya sp. PCC 7375]